MLPVYFESFIPEYGDYRHNLRNDHVRLMTHLVNLFLLSLGI